MIKIVIIIILKSYSGVDRDKIQVTSQEGQLELPKIFLKKIIEATLF